MIGDLFAIIHLSLESLDQGVINKLSFLYNLLMLNSFQMKTSIINIDPEIMSGAPVFRGTRVTIQTLFDHLENGKTLDDFLEGFPSVTKENALAVLELAKSITTIQINDFKNFQ